MLYGIVRNSHALTRSLRSRLGPSNLRCLLTLAIETSCDDTCVAVLSTDDTKHGLSRSGSDGCQARLHFHEKITSKNTGHGGIHPSEALESHRVNLATLIQKSLQHLPEAGLETPATYRLPTANAPTRQKPDFVSVTRGPGMRGNLYVGLDTAKGLATAWQIPFVGVHHMQAHALTPRLVHSLNSQGSETNPEPSFPFLTLLVSGGHTMLLNSQSLTSHTILANTIDIAIGDCLDKCGRSILPASIVSSTPDTSYAKYLSEYAFPSPTDYDSYPIPLRRDDEIHKPTNQFGWTFRPPLSEMRDLKFSFAGIPSHVERIMTRSQHSPTIRTSREISEEERLLLARTVLGVAFEHLGSRTLIALESLKNSTIEPESPTTSSASSSSASSSLPKALVISGGVAANPFLRYFFRRLLDAHGYGQMELIFPPVDLCTDNAAMIAWAGIEMYRAGYRTGLDCNAKRKWPMDSILDQAD